MHEEVAAAFVRRDEAEALLVTERDAGVTSSADTTLRDGKRIVILAPVGPEALPQDPISIGTR